MKHADNPNHANGTCEACGGPCAVYGCRYCPACYWPETYGITVDVGSKYQKSRRKAQSDIAIDPSINHYCSYLGHITR